MLITISLTLRELRWFWFPSHSRHSYASVRYQTSGDTGNSNTTRIHSELPSSTEVTYLKAESHRSSPSNQLYTLRHSVFISSLTHPSGEVSSVSLKPCQSSERFALHSSLIYSWLYHRGVETSRLRIKVKPVLQREHICNRSQLPTLSYIDHRTKAVRRLCLLVLDIHQIEFMLHFGMSCQFLSFAMQLFAS